MAKAKAQTTAPEAPKKKATPASATLDFEGAVANAPKSEKGLKQLQDLMDEADLLFAQSEELEAQLDAISSRYNFLKVKLLPDILSELQTEEWKNSSGTKVQLANFMSGSLPKKEEKPKEYAAAIKLLEDNGAESIIKTELTIPFKKSQHNEALALADDLRKKGYAAELASTVHAQSLQAFGRECLKSGKKISLETLGLFSGRYADITHAGEKKKQKRPKKAAAEEKA